MKCKGVISAGDQLTVEAGAEILKAGGNAFDAAIAATFMSFAASSSITSSPGKGWPYRPDQARVRRQLRNKHLRRPLDH